ncbi:MULTISPECIES: spore germination protein GerPB [Paenibacillus]|uniref:spore germination protein GerPB n=1 Tax=Paenibacillus TaxID=44249 RepID=UPI00203F82DA|nr:spore germination protein GerPB [Paenibacillus camelliae]MCM3633200.1 spore germination protein GerPB [Paenibacillus camelliae]
MFNVQQHIYVGTIRIESVSNSSMLQIGTSGGINAASYVTGQPIPGSTYDEFEPEDFFSPSLVPLPNPN